MGQQRADRILDSRLGFVANELCNPKQMAFFAVLTAKYAINSTCSCCAMKTQQDSEDCAPGGGRC